MPERAALQIAQQPAGDAAAHIQGCTFCILRPLKNVSVLLGHGAFGSLAMPPIQSAQGTQGVPFLPSQQPPGPALPWTSSGDVGLNCDVEHFLGPVLQHSSTRACGVFGVEYSHSPKPYLPGTACQDPWAADCVR
jgi:hypothetical protein